MLKARQDTMAWGGGGVEATDNDLRYPDEPGAVAALTCWATRQLVGGLAARGASSAGSPRRARATTTTTRWRG